jgi:DNA-binding response OmpR family regulator
LTIHIRPAYPEKQKPFFISGNMHDKNKILVIDDDETISAIVKSLLKPVGYDVISAMDGEAGIEMALADKPDAILLDQRMRGMSGHDVLKVLKKQEETIDIPVIMITGDNNLRQLALSLDLGAKDYILKPFNNTNLAMRVHNALN